MFMSFCVLSLIVIERVQVYKPDFNQAWQGIFRGNKNWVAGGFFLATREVMTNFVRQYRRAVTSFLDLKESNVSNLVE
jgi:hypothetical protein